MAYLENKSKCDHRIEYHKYPNQNMDSVMKGISSARHEQSDVLQQNGDFDEDYYGAVDKSHDRRELSGHIRQ